MGVDKKTEQDKRETHYKKAKQLKHKNYNGGQKKQ